MKSLGLNARYARGGAELARLQRRGVVLVGDDAVYLVADRLAPDQIKGVFLREVGVHYGLTGMLDERGFNDTLDRMAALNNAGNPAVKAAYARVSRDTPASWRDEEALGYLVENAPRLPLVRRLLAGRRAFLYRHFGIGGKRLSDADLVALAEASVRRATRNERCQDGAPATAEPAFSSGESSVADKYRAVRDAAQTIIDGAEAVARNLRPDLAEYGGDADVHFVWGNARMGLEHIGRSRGPETVLRVARAAAIGRVINHVPGKKTVWLNHEGTTAILSLDEHGEQKTWLLAGWEDGRPDVRGKGRTSTTPTQSAPTFGRDELVAGLDRTIPPTTDASQTGDRHSAPNGQPSNLSARQHAQVRTPAFIQYFGDWLGKARLDVLQSMDARRIADNRVDNLTGAALRDAARPIYRAQAKQGPITMQDDRVVRLTGVGFNKSRSHSADPRTLRLVPHLRDLLHDAVSLWSEPVRNPQAQDSVRVFHNYGVQVDFGDGAVYARLVVRESVNGEIYYDNDLSSIEEGVGAGVEATRITKAEAAPRADTKKLNQWITEVNASQSSQVVDESGEPLVVYHGTSSSFDAFSKDKTGSKTKAIDARNGFFYRQPEHSRRVREGVSGRFEYDVRILERARTGDLRRRNNPGFTARFQRVDGRIANGPRWKDRRRGRVYERV